MAKPLYILVSDGGDGSYYPQYTLDPKLIEALEYLHDNDVLDYESGFSDGDGFHYETILVPDDSTKESLGISHMMDANEYIEMAEKHKLGEE